jgi:hypothetical protein
MNERTASRVASLNSRPAVRLAAGWAVLSLIVVAVGLAAALTQEPDSPADAAWREGYQAGVNACRRAKEGA